MRDANLLTIDTHQVRVSISNPVFLLFVLHILQGSKSTDLIQYVTENYDV